MDAPTTNVTQRKIAEKLREERPTTVMAFRNALKAHVKKMQEIVKEAQQYGDAALFRSTDTALRYPT
eukprot:2483021-Alexandrium_andersonii.AAC.1